MNKIEFSQQLNKQFLERGLSLNPRLLDTWIKAKGKNDWLKSDVGDALKELLPLQALLDEENKDTSSTVDGLTAVTDVSNKSAPHLSYLRRQPYRLEGGLLKPVLGAMSEPFDPLNEKVHVKFLNIIAEKRTKEEVTHLIEDFAYSYGPLFLGSELEQKFGTASLPDKSDYSESLGGWAYAVATFRLFEDMLINPLPRYPAATDVAQGTEEQWHNWLTTMEIYTQLTETIESVRISAVIGPSPRLIWSANSLWTFMCLGLFLDHNLKNFELWETARKNAYQKCANPGCERPYFLSDRKRKYCSGDCTTAAATASFKPSEERKSYKRLHDNISYYHRANKITESEKRAWIARIVEAQKDIKKLRRVHDAWVVRKDELGGSKNG